MKIFAHSLTDLTGSFGIAPKYLSITLFNKLLYIAGVLLYIHRHVIAYTIDCNSLSFINISLIIILNQIFKWIYSIYRTYKKITVYQLNALIQESINILRSYNNNERFKILGEHNHTRQSEIIEHCLSYDVTE